MKIAISQINLQIGNFSLNTENIKRYINQAIDDKVQLIIFPELTTTVKGAKDLLLIPEYIEKAEKLISELMPFSNDINIVIGGIEKNSDGLLNTAYLLKKNSATPIAYEQNIENENKKYFVGKNLNKVFEIDGIKFCAVLGNDELPNIDNCHIIRLNSQPYTKEYEIKSKLTQNTIYVNHIGLSQENIYQGESFVTDINNNLIAIAPQFEAKLLITDINSNKTVIYKNKCKEEQIFAALTYAFKEFCTINNFKKALIGLSGGIDSALTAVIMCNAIGAANVLGITMPSKYSTEGSWNDSYDLAKNLGMECKTVPIKPLFDTFINDIQGQLYADLAEENLQARLRGNILMAYSNRENRVLVTTGNKSECAVGYCTLYGDTCGGINLISDLYKQEVYALSNWINRVKEIIPTNTITKAPSAELRPDQKDQDSLPDYAILDEILYRYIENNESVQQISKDFDETLVKDIINKLNIMEFKRNQFTYCLKISKKALLNRDYPIVNKFRY
ncbi:NAD(+) synthase [bacterium]|nr:NAD(+) synthase [bacterium]